MNRTDVILNALSRDAIAEAEALTGKSYKENELTQLLGLLRHTELVKNKRSLMDSERDTNFRNDPIWLKNRLAEDGFVLLHSEEFVGHNYGDGAPTEEFNIFFCYRRGLLVFMETFGRGLPKYQDETNFNGSVNSISVAFNWRPAKPDLCCRLTDGGGSRHGVIDPNPLFKVKPSQYNPEGHNYATVGTFDGREGLFTKLAWAEENGQFITPWLERPFLWLLTYADTKRPDYDHNVINEARLQKLPPNVRGALA